MIRLNRLNPAYYDLLTGASPTNWTTIHDDCVASCALAIGALSIIGITVTTHEVLTVRVAGVCGRLVTLGLHGRNGRFGTLVTDPP